LSEAIGDRVKALRRKLGLSQTDLAKAAHLSGSYVSLIEAGRRPASDRALRLIAERLGCSVDYLRTGRGGPTDHVDALELSVQFAEMALRSGDHQEALVRFGEALSAAEQAEDDGLLGRARWGLARAHEFCGDLEEAIRRYEALLEGEDGTSDQTVEIQTALCRAYMECGDLSRAVDVGEQALTRTRDSRGGLLGEAAVELASTLVGCYQDRGDLTRAHLLAQEVIAEAERHHSPRARGAAYWSAGLVAEARGDLAAARRYLDRALALYGEGDNARGIALLRVAQAWLILQDSEPDVPAARALLERALLELPAVGTSVDMAYADTELARCDLLEGRLPEALAGARQALERLGSEPRLEAAAARLVAARALRAMGDSDAAANELQRAAATLQVAGSGREAAAVWRELAETFLDVGKQTEAIQAFRQAADAVGVSRRRHPADVSPTGSNAAGAQ
jgi:tetratricopeptide (TPR) repeat protein